MKQVKDAQINKIPTKRDRKLNRIETTSAPRQQDIGHDEQKATMNQVNKRKQPSGELMRIGDLATITLKEVEDDTRQMKQRQKKKKSMHKHIDRKIVQGNEKESKDLMAIIKSIIMMPCEATETMPLKFKNTREAAEANALILEENNWDVGAVIAKQKRTVMHPGTEFRPVE